jgi:hypothetical protein
VEEGSFFKGLQIDFDEEGVLFFNLQRVDFFENLNGCFMRFWIFVAPEEAEICAKSLKAKIHHLRK